MSVAGGEVDAQCAALCEAFPSIPRKKIFEVLKRSRTVDEAAAELIQVQHPGETSTAAGPRDGQRQPRPCSSGSRASWGSLSAAGAGHGQVPQPPLAPRFRLASRQPDGDALVLADFPAGPLAGAAAVASLHPAASSSASAGWARQQPQQAVLRQQQRPQQQPQQGVLRQQQRPQQQQRRQSSQTEAAGQAAVVKQLVEMHGWAGHELVEAVLAAAGGDGDTAAALLADMVADGPRTRRQTCSSAQVSAGTEHKSSSSTAAAADAAVSAAVAAAEAAAPATLGAAAGYCDEANRGGDSNDHDADSEQEQQDPYYRFRRRALQASRCWQRAARGAAAAYSTGDHSVARQLAAEAQRLRQEALAAHAEAAERIETENNQHNSLFELDLHGLHTQEATAALDRRLDLLHSLLADPAIAAATAMAPLAAGGGGGGPGGGGVRRQHLRVVVGRGVHSSGGEASIPRVVENHLRAAGHRFHHRLGVIDVQLRAPAALAGTAGTRAPAD